MNWSIRFGPLLLLLCWVCSYHGASRQNAEAAGGLEAFDELLQPVGGYDEIQKNLSYPEFARKDAIAGKVVVEALINEKGRIEEMKIVESLSVECD